MPTAYAYLVISPNPQLGNFIYTGKGVEIKSGENAKLDYRESNIHYVKIGHQSGLEDRFTKYNTHNPSIWFRHLMIEDPPDSTTKHERLKDVEMDDQTKRDSLSANFFQNMLLEWQYVRARRAKEWFVVDNKLDSLRDLCNALDTDQTLKEVKIKKKRQVIDGEANDFKSERDCVQFLKNFGDDVFSFEA